MSDPSLKELVALSAELGRNIGLVQGAGGNLSLKCGNDFWVKASGTWLADADSREVFVRLDLREARAKLASGSEDFTSCVVGGSALRPSIETSMHLLLPQAVVVHVHSINTISWAVRRDARAEIGRRLAGLAWGWLDYRRPGLPLSRAIGELLEAEGGKSVLVLGNHGLVVAGETVADARALLSDVEGRLATTPRERPDLRRADVDLESVLTPGSRLPRNRNVHGLAISSLTGERLRGALYPDHAVFLGTALPVLPSDSPRADVAAVLDQYPYCSLISGVGVVLGEKCSAGAEAMLECFAELVPTLPDAGELRYLNESELRELVDWEAEAWRKSLAFRTDAG